HSPLIPSHLHSFPTRRSSDLLLGDVTCDFRESPEPAGGVSQSCDQDACHEAGSVFTKPPTFLLVNTQSRGGFQSPGRLPGGDILDRKSTRLNSSHVKISYAVF